MILRISWHLFFFYNFVYNMAWFFLNLEDFMEILTLNQVNQYIFINHLFHISCTWRQSIMSWYTCNNEKFWNVLFSLELMSLMTVSTWTEKRMKSCRQTHDFMYNIFDHSWTEKKEWNHVHRHIISYLFLPKTFFLDFGIHRYKKRMRQFSI